MKDEKEKQTGYTDRPEDRHRWKDNAREDIKAAIPEDEREKYADAFGPNWASIMSGCGDQ